MPAFELYPTDTNYINEVLWSKYDLPKAALLGVIWTGSAISLLALAARLLIRWKLLHKLKADDWLAIAAMALSLASAITYTFTSHWAYYVDRRMEFDDADLRELWRRINLLSRTHLVGYVLAWTCLWTVKLSFLAFFRGLGQQIRFQRILWWCILVLTLVTYAISIGLLNYNCMASINNRKGYSAEACRSRSYLDGPYFYMRFLTAFDMITDALIVALSANIVWRARIQWRKKLVLGLICSLTVILVIVAIVRITLWSLGKDPDYSWLMLLNSIEMTLAIIIACAASFRSLYCQARNRSRTVPYSNNKPEQENAKKTPPRSLFASVFADDTILGDEVTHWGREGDEEEEPRGSRENLCAPEAGNSAVALSSVSPDSLIRKPSPTRAPYPDPYGEQGSPARFE